ncbi:MAG: inositol monophosphatase family protein [Thermodesulfobacteriota bacterium]
MRTHQVRHKGVIDLVTEADLAAEAIIVAGIRQAFPEHGIISEEQAPAGSTAGHFWLVDPLDGTVNFAHHFPWFCVSVAYGWQGKIRAGVVFHPILDELFWAEEGRGACLGERPLRVSGETRLQGSLVATGFPYDVHEAADAAIRPLAAVLPHVQGVRRAGAAALDLAQVAAGRFEAFFEIKLKPWDTAAGMLLVAEAGGVCTDFAGRPFDPFSTEILASNGLVHPDLLRLLG